MSETKPEGYVPVEERILSRGLRHRLIGTANEQEAHEKLVQEHLSWDAYDAHERMIAEKEKALAAKEQKDELAGLG